MRAIILAGGKGARLKPFTATIPKPLVPIGGEVPILEIIIRQLSSCGFKHITIAVNHMANLIMAFFKDGSQWGTKIDYSIESQPLGTIGPLTLIPDLPSDFLVMNGDILCDLDYMGFYNYHIRKHNQITVSTVKRRADIDFGVLKYDANNVITDFVEKPVYLFDVSMGIYCLNRCVVERLLKGQRYGFDNLMLDSIAGKNTIEVKPFCGFWLDIGRFEDYEYANENHKEIKTKLGLTD